MAEVRKIKWNGLTAASFFAGSGGSSTGYRMAGFKVLWANEFVEEAFNTYKANKAPYTHLNSSDIRALEPSQFLEEAGVGIGELDVLDGSPPCASFSTAGARDKHWGKNKKYSDRVQRADDLFFEYIRMVHGIRPKVFVAENVEGLIKGKAKGYFLEIMAQFKALGYNVSARVLDAQWLGVPQIRKRLIFVGTRQDTGLMPAYPSPLQYRYTLQDVCPHIVMEKRGGRPENWRPAGESPCSTIVASGWGVSPTAYFSGGTWVQARRLDTGGELVAGIETRKLTIDELRLVCSFPSDFVLTGDEEQQWERMGRAVPPLMMRAIAGAIRDKVFHATA